MKDIKFYEVFGSCEVEDHYIYTFFNVKADSKAEVAEWLRENIQDIINRPVRGFKTEIGVSEYFFDGVDEEGSEYVDYVWQIDIQPGEIYDVEDQKEEEE